MKTSILKTSLVLFTFTLYLSPVFSQSPQKMTYQAVIRDTNDQLAVSQNIGMKVSILLNSTSGTAVYVETHTANTNENGLLTLEIGGGTVVSGSFSLINWGNGSYYLKTETDLNGGTNYSITSTTQLLSVPYALFAANSASTVNAGTGLQLSGNTMNALNTTPMWNANYIQNIPIGSSTPNFNDVLQFNGSAWAPAQVSGGGTGTIINCGTTNTNYTVRGTGSNQWECTNAIVINSSKHVGIGSTSPSSSFDLTIGSGGFLVEGSTTSSNIYGRLRIGSTSSTSYTLQVDGHGYFTDGIRIGSTTSPPSNGLYAYGDIKTNTRFIQGSSTSGTGTLMVRTSSGELRPQSSTLKVKENIKPLAVDKEKVFSLRPVSYNLKPALGGGNEVGLIAEEVELVLPELVVYGPARQWIGETGTVAVDENGEEILNMDLLEPYSVSYDRLAIYLLDIIKEQEQRISELERKLEELSK